MKIYTGHFASKHPIPPAIVEALRHHDSERTLVLLFGATQHLVEPQTIVKLAALCPKSKLIGCSTAGEICGNRVLDDSLTVAIGQFQTTSLRDVATPIDSTADSYAAGCRLGKALAAEDLRGIFVLSDGLHVNGSELVRGLNATIAPEVVVTGGLAGDGSRFKQTWVLCDRLPKDKTIAAVGLYGEKIRIFHGSKGGWDIFGPERVVTRSQDNVLFELDGKPALALYKRYLGDLAAELPATALLFPLAIRTGKNDEHKIVRTILGVDEAQQSMTFAGNIPQGAFAQLMRANFDRLITGAERAAQFASLKNDNSANLTIAISCVGRRLVLGERTEEELEATLVVLPAGTQQAGFYSYGEISPLVGSKCELHNQTMTLTVFSEKD